NRGFGDDPGGGYGLADEECAADRGERGDRGGAGFEGAGGGGGRGGELAVFAPGFDQDAGFGELGDCFLDRVGDVDVALGGPGGVVDGEIGGGFELAGSRAGGPRLAAGGADVDARAADVGAEGAEEGACLSEL